MFRFILILLVYASMMSVAALVWAAEEPLAVIVSQGHGKGLKKEEVALIFKRKKLFWSDGSKVQPVNLPATNVYRRTFSQVFLGANPEEMETYWNEVYFHGISPPYVLLSANAVERFVMETPGAIGYVPYCYLANHTEVALVVSTAGQIVDDPAMISCTK